MTAEEHACPRCGIRFDADEEGVFATCPACGSLLHLGDEAEIAHQRLVPVLDEAAVLGRLARWLRDREVLADPKEVATRLLWFPFWLLPGDALVPAAPLLASNLGAFRAPAGDRVAFREGEAGPAEIVPASVPPAAIVDDEATRRAARLLHVPFREVRFRLWGHDYTVWFDAATGQALDFDLPPTSERRLDVTYALLLLALFAAGVYGVRTLFGGTAAPGWVGAAVLAGAAGVFLAVAFALIRLTESR